jgi:hypothetical protein
MTEGHRLQLQHQGHQRFSEMIRLFLQDSTAQRAAFGVAHINSWAGKAARRVEAQRKISAAVAFANAVSVGHRLPNQRVTLPG